MGGPPINFGPPCGTPNGVCVPIDDGIWILFILGLVIVIKYAYEQLGRSRRL
jgi:hypothetical protein